MLKGLKVNFFLTAHTQPYKLCSVER